MSRLEAGTAKLRAFARINSAAHQLFDAPPRHGPMNAKPVFDRRTYPRDTRRSSRATFRIDVTKCRRLPRSFHKVIAVTLLSFSIHGFIEPTQFRGGPPILVSRGANPDIDVAAGLPSPTAPTGLPRPYVLLLCSLILSVLRCQPKVAFASLWLSAHSFNAYTDFALALISPPSIANRLARGHQPRADTRTSTVIPRIIHDNIDVITVFESLLLGTSPSFRPPEGGKAVRLRTRSVIR